MSRFTEKKLLRIATVFVALYAIALTLSPAAREVSWQVDYRWAHWAGALTWGLFAWLAHRALNRLLPDRDPYLLPAAALLIGWGLLTIWRLDAGFGLRQTLWLALSLPVLWLILRLPPGLTTLRRYKYLWLSGGLALTALTLIFGTNPAGFGPRLWLGAGGIYLQPSEPLKLLLIVYLAAYLADHPLIRTRTFPYIVPTLLAAGLALLILIVQRDLGTASIFILLYTIMLFLATGRRRVLLACAAALILAGVLGTLLVPHVRTRMEAWLNPWADPLGRSYQIVQSLLAVAAGGLIGRGPGLGNPGLVPVAVSDFIFVAIAEEGGTLGALALIGLLGLLTARGLRLALRAPDRFRRLLAGGLSAYLGVQSLLIIGGNLRLLPLTGVTLPFVSYGGSSLLTSIIALGLLLHIGSEPEEEPAPLPGPTPYDRLGLLLIVGLALTALAHGWWALVRGPDLLTRADNARRSIADRYVKRGALLDRENRPIQQTVGRSGSYARVYLYPPLGPVAGYTSATYGQSGLEAGLDPYLRGTAGNPTLLIWWNHLLYGRPPTGLDVRLSLDLDLQAQADQQLGEQVGAAVLLNVASGEILVMSSHPGFDANLLEQQAATLFTDSSAPLLNRATQGQYPAGAALGPFLLSAVGQDEQLPSAVPPVTQLMIGTSLFACPQPDTWPLDWKYAIANGCPGAYLSLVDQLGTDRTLQTLHAFGLYTAPGVPMPAAPASTPPIEFNRLRLLAGGDGLRVSPLQMALAAAALSGHGQRPAARIALAVNTPQAGWVVPAVEDAPVQAISPAAADATATLLRQPEQIGWESLTTIEGGKPITWYLAGTPPDWQGVPLVVVVLLEDGERDLAASIGRELMQTALGTK